MLSEEMNLQIEMAGTDRACMMLVCINGCENNMPYGIIVNYHLPCPVSFGGIHGLILALDEVCEWWVPLWQQQNRGFCKRKGAAVQGAEGESAKKSGKVLEKRKWQRSCFPM